MKVSDGVPEIVPDPFWLVVIVNPGGKPFATDGVPSGDVLVVVLGTLQVYPVPVPPDACSTWEYATLVAPELKDGVVTVSAGGDGGCPPG